MARFFTRIAALLALLAPLLASVPAQAEPADIDAAARGVVRVVIVGERDGELFPISHGTGFAVTGDTVVTNAHVVRDALRDEGMQIGIVPTGGGEAVYGRIIAVLARNDLALIRITGDLRLPPLALAGGMPPDSGEVTSVGYPMNVDRAQGLDISDIFRSQPPVKSRGFISGARPSRQFDTILHTAPIARGNSGGPLLDPCGRVVGVNSFGADNDGGDAEFFFAVSNRELVPFLRANDVEPRINTSTCRSMADLDEAERERLEREQMAARADLAERAEERRTRRERALLEAEQGVIVEREDRVFLSFVLLLVAFGLGQWAMTLWRAEPRDETRLRIAAGATAVVVLAALAAYLTRPGLDEIDRRPRTQPDHQRQGRGYRIRLDARRMREHPHAIRFCRRQLEPGVRAQFGRRGLGQQLRPRPPHLPLRTLSAAAQRDDRSPRSTRQIHRARMRQRQCRRAAGRVAGRSAWPVAAAGQRAAGVRV